MKNIILIFKNSILRNKLMIFLTLFSAVLMSFTFYVRLHAEDAGINVEKISVGLADNDGKISENVKSYLENGLNMVVLENDYDFLSKLLIDKQISAIIEVPRGFGDSAINGRLEKLVITTLGDYENAAFIEAYMNSYMRGLSVISQAAGGDAEKFAEMLSSQKSPNTITLAETNSRVGKKTQTADAYRMMLGFLLMMISGITVFFANQILIDRRLGTYNRMRCSSLKSLEYVAGVSLFGAVCCTAANLVFNAFTFILGEEMPISFGMAVGACELFMLFSVGLAVLFALLVNDQRTLMTVGVGYATIGSMLGGVWFPVGTELGVVGNIAKILPQYWLMDLARNGSVSGYSALSAICILALSAVLVYLVSAVIFTRKNA